MKWPRLCACLMCNGRTFHNMGAVNEKALCPKHEWEKAKRLSNRNELRCSMEEMYGISRLANSGGPCPYKHLYVRERILKRKHFSIKSQWSSLIRRRLDGKPCILPFCSISRDAWFWSRLNFSMYLFGRPKKKWITIVESGCYRCINNKTFTLWTR